MGQSLGCVYVRSEILEVEGSYLRVARSGAEMSAMQEQRTNMKSLGKKSISFV